MSQADAAIATRCRELGIPEQFRPGLNLFWHNRGENALRERRAELRRVAQTSADAAAKRVRLAIEAAALDLLTKLATGALGSAEARDFLAAMPTVEELMPPLDITALGRPVALPGE